MEMSLCDIGYKDGGVVEGGTSRHNGGLWKDMHAWIWTKSLPMENEKILLRLVYEQTMEVLRQRGHRELEGLAPVLAPTVQFFEIGGALAKDMNEKQYLNLQKAYIKIDLEEKEPEAGFYNHPLKKKRR